MPVSSKNASAGRTRKSGPAVTRTATGPATAISARMGADTQMMIRSTASSSGLNRPERAGDSPRASHSTPATSTRLTITKVQPAVSAASICPMTGVPS
jgi:hypothetical protein